MLHGDLGRSLWQATPVTEPPAARLPVTFELGLMALLVALTIALPIGTWSALRQDSWSDHLGPQFSILLLAVPSFWLRHHGGGVPVHLVGLVARSRLRALGRTRCAT